MTQLQAQKAAVLFGCYFVLFVFSLKRLQPRSSHRFEIFSSGLLQFCFISFSTSAWRLVWRMVPGEECSFYYSVEVSWLFTVYWIVVCPFSVDLKFLVTPPWAGSVLGSRPFLGRYSWNSSCRLALCWGPGRIREQDQRSSRSSLHARGQGLCFSLCPRQAFGFTCFLRAETPLLSF